MKPPQRPSDSVPFHNLFHFDEWCEEFPAPGLRQRALFLLWLAYDLLRHPPLLAIVAIGGEVAATTRLSTEFDDPMLVDLCRQGRLDLDAFVTERIGINDVEEAFDKMHKGDVLRSVVMF